MTIADLIARPLFAATVLLSTIIIFATAGWTSDPVYVVCAILGSVGGALLPRVTASLALGALALGGNRPGTPHFVASIVLGAALFIGLTVRQWVEGRYRRVESPYDQLPVFLGLVYLLISLLSLVSIPLNHVIDDARNLFDRFQLAESTRAFLFVNEHALLYSYLSVYLTALAFFLSLSLFRLCRGNPNNSQLLLGAIGGGLLVASLIGLVDYYDFIDLRSVRPLDPVVNPGELQFRLQSFFAHSGWFAEYVTLTIPTCLLLLALPAPFWVRTALIILAMLVGEFVLILTYQRGGWLSYPLTLIAIWAAIYVVRRLELDAVDVIDALKRSLVKVLISIPLTLVVSISLLVLLQRGSDSTESKQVISRYSERLRDMGRTSDRTEFVVAGFLLGSRHPILGGGSESFAWRFDREVDSPDGAFAGRFNLPLHGTAHNVYAQTFAGKGVFGLFALVVIPLVLIRAALNSIRDRRTVIETKLIALVGACFACAFLIYGNVQEVFYIQSLQYLFFAVVAIVAATNPPEPWRGDRAALAFLVVLAGLVSHLIWEYISPGHARTFAERPREFGCFPEESVETDPFQWCGSHAVVKVTRPSLGQTPVLVLTAGPERQTITITKFSDQAPVTEMRLNPGERKILALPDTLFTGLTSPVYLRLDAETSFVPALVFPGSDDRRRLAYRLSRRDLPLAPTGEPAR